VLCQDTNASVPTQQALLTLARLRNANCYHQQWKEKKEDEDGASLKCKRCAMNTVQKGKDVSVQDTLYSSRKLLVFMSKET